MTATGPQTRNVMTRRQPKGAVLVLVIGAIAILSVLAFEVSHRASVTSREAERSKRTAVFSRAFDSGIEISKAVLMQCRKGTGFDYLGDGWSKEIQISLDGADIRVRFSDECGKINLNEAVRTNEGKKQVARVFEFLRAEEPEREQEWREMESLVRARLHLNEDPSAKPPVPMPPLYTLDGLREQGLSVEQVFGGNDKGVPGLSEFFTCFGPKTINLNTAPEAVLYSLGMDYDRGLVQRIATWRGGPEVFRPFRQANDLEMVEGIVERTTVDGQNRVLKNLATKVAGFTAVSSTYFSARISVKFMGREREGWAFFEVPSIQGSSATPVRLVAFEEIEQ